MLTKIQNSQAAAERLVLDAMDDTFVTCSLRPSVFFGPGDFLVIPTVYDILKRGQTAYEIGEPFGLRDISYVDNIADAHVLAAENLVSSRTAAGEAFFIQNNEPIPFRDFCLAIWAFFGHIPPYHIRIPVFLALVAGFIAEIVAWVTGSPLLLSRGAVKELSTMRYANGDKAERVLGYEPRIKLDEGLRITLEVGSVQHQAFRSLLPYDSDWSDLGVRSANRHLIAFFRQEVAGIDTNLAKH